MRSRFWLLGVGLAALLGAPSPTSAGGPGVGIVKIHGTVEIKSLVSGGQWRRAKLGELHGAYTNCLLRTGPRSWVHLRDFEAPRSPRKNVGCVDANSVVRIRSNCGYRIEVLQGQVSAIDGKPGKSLFRVASR
jgi:hypothetical protein